MNHSKTPSSNNLSEGRAIKVLTSLFVAFYICTASTAYAAYHSGHLHRAGSFVLKKSTEYISILQAQLETTSPVDTSTTKTVKTTPPSQKPVTKKSAATPIPQTYTTPTNTTSDYDQWVQESRDAQQQRVDQMNADYDARVSEMRSDFEQSKTEAEQNFEDVKAENAAKTEAWKEENGF